MKKINIKIICLIISSIFFITVFVNAENITYNEEDQGYLVVIVCLPSSDEDIGLVATGSIVTAQKLDENYNPVDDPFEIPRGLIPEASFWEMFVDVSNYEITAFLEGGVFYNYKKTITIDESVFEYVDWPDCDYYAIVHVELELVPKSKIYRNNDFLLNLFQRFSVLINNFYFL